MVWISIAVVVNSVVAFIEPVDIYKNCYSPKIKS